MNISVVVPTRGAGPGLERCLRSVLAQRRAADEILVVDNGPGSLDAGALPQGVRLAREPRRGVEHARNRGLREARGEIVAFLDDDCLASPGWLAALEACFADPAVAAAGGPARPRWLSAPPRALRLSPRALSYLGLLDWGRRRKPIDPAREHLVGANLALRKSSLESGGRFVGVFPFPGTGSCAEDTEMTRGLARRHLVIYEPEAWVEHQIAPAKTRWPHLVARAFCIEAANVRLGRLPEQRLSLAELVLWEGGLQAAKTLGRLFGRWLAPLPENGGDGR